MTKVKNFVKPELTLGKLVKHQSQMLGMILLILGKDQNIIKIHQDEIISVRVEDEVHHAREVGGALTRPKDMTVYS